MSPDPRESANGLTVSGARKRFAGSPALEGIDLTLARGEWLGLLGPNGAGKTTLMRAIAGLTRLDEGQVLLFGRRVNRERDRDARARLGFVPQEIALYPLLTARENLEVFGRLHGVRGRTLHERVEWALDWTGLRPRAGRPVQTYSEGMKRRLNIACGVLHDPGVVLLDEPTVGVDPHGRRRIQEMLDGLRRRGTSLLQSSHQLDEIQTCCDRMVIVDRGRVIAEGTLAELASRTDLFQRTVRLSFRSTISLDLGPRFHVEGSVARGTVGDVATDLARLLERVSAAGVEIEDIHVEPPRLEDVFTRLTGGELRE